MPLRACPRPAKPENSSSGRPRRACARHFMPAIRSLIVLISFRATGVSERRRKFAGVGFGRMFSAAIPVLENPYVFRIDGNATVRRFSLNADDPAAPAAMASPKDTPAIRRSAPRTFSRMFMIPFVWREHSCPQTRRDSLETDPFISSHSEAEADPFISCHSEAERGGGICVMTFVLSLFPGDS